jgi:dTDP-glucose 4,6-dehydratase
MKLLITGAGGFIGSHLTEAAVKAGHAVKAFLHYNSNNHLGWLEQLEVRKDIECVAGDIRDLDSVLGAMKGYDAVLHLAALIGIPYSYVSPIAYIRTNIEGTYNVLQAARSLELTQVLVTSTSETYGTAQTVPIGEDHPLVGQSPYSATKISADQLAISYFRSFGLPVKIVRPFNTYGPRQSARAIIPTVISQLASGSTKLKLGNLHPTRDLTFVRDTVNGFLAILNADGLFGEVTNIGMNEEISVGDLVKLIGEIAGVKPEIDTDSTRLRPALSEVERLRCDNTKICSKTTWKPSYTLRSGLKETFDWIMNHQDLYKPGQYNV